MLSLLSRASDNTWRAIPALKSGWKTSKNTHDFRLDFNNLSFGFSGCGWLIPYYVGVAHSIRSNIPSHVLNRSKFCGSSSGSLMATALASDVDLDKMRAMIHNLRRELSKNWLGPVGVCTSVVSRGIRGLLPPEPHVKVNGKLYISITEAQLDGKSFPVKNKLVNQFSSEDDLVHHLMASCYVPFYYEKPVIINDKICLDGGFSNNHPRLNEHTIRVSPYSKSSAHIKPPETFTKYTPWNGFVKLLSIDEMKALEERGFKDAELFFQSKKSSMNPFSNLATSL